ncbi:MAG TPA: DNA-binding response regulator [Gemmatimonas aurantiaca]|uniref:OmpR family two-component response regulator n=2 Tax=Gemmatimonas aurantiaca TaxID=173480 RepID=C1A8B6_GEMAT|nr:response regulator transcription factor [Gemmatimonas aurantiaca]BAH38476.1 OmpR family two-component response regulator [Gemmatimonas aurantiaca T-27]HCT56197.1 DNA-binding response regulator [Gemmatimonas aurantiaca]
MTTESVSASFGVSILVVEDNALLAAGVRSNLEFEGYQVTVAATGREGLRLAKSRAHALIVLDLMLPDIDGFRVLRELREHGVETPVLILTAMGDETDKVRGFRFGADDYVTKPFGLMEFLARVQALLRRSRTAKPAHDVPTVQADNTRRFGNVAIDLSTRSVTLEGSAVMLRPREYDLLVALVRRDGAIASREELLREVWGYDDSVVSRTVDTHMAELRRKLETDPSEPRWLLTVRKTGYRMAMS